MTSEDINSQMQELQFIEQQIQGFMMQKQGVQIESNEISNALNELEKTKDEVYKILSGAMIKSNKEDLIKELKEKKRKAEMKIDAISKQEKILEHRADELKEELNASIKKKK